MQTACHFVRGLDIYRTWYPGQVLELIPHGYLGQLYVYSVYVVYIYFFYIERICIFIRIFHKFKNSVTLDFQRN